jgi:hypothetical protein
VTKTDWKKGRGKGRWEEGGRRKEERGKKKRSQKICA